MVKEATGLRTQTELFIWDHMLLAGGNKQPRQARVVLHTALFIGAETTVTFVFKELQEGFYNFLPEGPRYLISEENAFKSAFFL